MIRRTHVAMADTVDELLAYFGEKGAAAAAVVLTKKKIAEESRLTLGRVRHGLSALEEEGLIAIERRKGEDGGGYVASAYLITPRGLERMKRMEEND